MYTSWFQTLFGFDEKRGNSRDYLQTQQQFRVEGEQKELIRSLANNKVYVAGKFSTPTLAELRAQGQKILSGSEQKGTVRLVHETTDDVLEAHADPRNRGAMFQAASQFNCLEFVGPSVTPERGVTGYAGDATQGPACAIAAGPGTVYRNYFAPTGPDAKIGQTHDNQINTLDLFEEAIDNTNGTRYFTVRNGYTSSTSAKLAALQQHFNTLDEKDIDALRDKIKIGLQAGTQVTFAGRDWRSGWEDCSDQNILVSQAYCSALSVSYSGLSESDWEVIGPLILEAAYEATLWATVINATMGGSNRVLLTFVGGGCFGNPRRWLGRAIARAVHTLTKAGANLEVACLHFRSVDRQMFSSIQTHLQALETTDQC